ncbi:MAG: hypothetical protein AAFO85_18475 [Cyanobacteria bacterium J06598_4]
MEFATNLADELTTANQEAQESWEAIIAELEEAEESLETEMEGTREKLTSFQEKITEVSHGFTTKELYIWILKTPSFE